MGAELIGLAAAAALVAGAWYAAACCWWPFAACLKCKGDGKFRSPSGRAWRRCRRCKGSGERIRVGRRIWNWLAGTAHKAVG